jgi:hypothetical protein
MYSKAPKDAPRSPEGKGPVTGNIPRDGPFDGRVARLLTSLLVGAARWRRGERLSGRQYIHAHAVGCLLRLLQRHVPPLGPAALDDLDPFRRFEAAHPSLGREMEEALRQEPPAAARRLLAIAGRELAERLPGYPWEGAEALGRWLEEP